ncbi:MAG: NADH-quinone oxidoreductase subunit H [Candidatus Nezhaarchaeota archaeon]|nr:NADH-quinone oxidoreductase subunit H [Candidatus Nezhaarchaeota archaeon]
MIVPELIVEAFLYPGLLFLWIVAWLTQWFHRKVYARMQNRIGPLYTGFMGLLQPIADYTKLFFKEDVSIEGSNSKLSLSLLFIALGSLVALPIMLPLAPLHPIAADYDVVLALYLLVWPTITVALIGMLTPNPFSATGSSRVFSMMVAYEVTFAASLLTPITLASSKYGANFSLYLSCLNAWKLWLNWSTAPLMALAVAVALLSFQCKLLVRPFDIPEAETEIVAGPFTEYSGFKLALIMGLHDLEMVVGSLLLIMLFFGGFAPFAWLPWPIALMITIVEYLLVIIAVTWIKAVTARLRVDQAIGMFWKYVVPTSMLALVLSLLTTLS